MQAVINGLAILRRAIVELGPYLMLELVLPGGTIIALALFLYRRGKLGLGEHNPARPLAVSLAAIARRR